MRRSSRPRRNPIPPRDPNFLLDPYPWVEGTVLSDYCEEHTAGFFHVTTSHDRVLRKGLRARSETGVIGLGGGASDPRGDWVSFVINYPRALWLFASMRGLLVAAKDSDAGAVLRLVLEWTGFPGDVWSFNWDEDEEGGWDRQSEDLAEFCADLGLEPPDDIQSLAFGEPWEEMIERQADALNSIWATPEQRYALAQFVEGRLRSTFSDDWGDFGVCMPLVGFTASAKKYLSLEPEQFSIVQAAVRASAPEDIISQECEIRFKSQDIQLVSINCQDERNVLRVPPRFED